VPDTTAPETTLTGGPSGQTNDPTPTFTFVSSEPGSRFTCQIDDDPAFACASPYTPTVALTEGQHTFSVYATDAHGNADPAPEVRGFTVAGAPPPDVDPPETTITDGPSGDTSDATPTFAFSSDEAGSTFVCQLDQGLALPCTSPHTTESLAAGQHVFSVYARDTAGNADPTPATREFTIVGATMPAQVPNAPVGTLEADLLAPSIALLRISPPLFRAARSGPSLSALIGTHLSVTLSEAATVTFRVNRLLPGRRVGGRCVRPSAGNRGAPGCTRSVALRGRFVRRLGAGTIRLRYRGRLAGRSLRPGRYLLLARARDDAGNLSARRRARFAIVP
jgi:hypothetical protein